MLIPAIVGSATEKVVYRDAKPLPFNDRSIDHHKKVGGCGKLTPPLVSTCPKRQKIALGRWMCRT